MQVLWSAIFTIGCLLQVTHSFRGISPCRRQNGKSQLLMMKTLVIGSTGRTGQRIVNQLSEISNQNDTIRALYRTPSLEKAQNLFNNNNKVELFSSELDIKNSANTLEQLSNAMTGCKTVVCALGALESDALNFKAPYLVDGKLTQLAIEAATNSPDVDHFVLVSSLGTDKIGFPASILNLFWGVLSWKRQSELKLISSGLKYTIIRPGGMEKPKDDFELTNNMKIFPPSTKFSGLISRKQIASLCAAAVNNVEDSSNLVVEAVADPSFPKKSANELFKDFPKPIPDSVWRNELNQMEYYVLREAGTERPFTSPLNDEKRAGVYSCAGCGNQLFSSSYKFNSGTGWPSFFAPIKKESVMEVNDFSLGFPRVEVTCSNCGGHLGHVFPDGPKPTGLRYCMNGVALKFQTFEKIEKVENN